MRAPAVISMAMGVVAGSVVFFVAAVCERVYVTAGARLQQNIGGQWVEIPNTLSRRIGDGARAGFHGLIFLGAALCVVGALVAIARDHRARSRTQDRAPEPGVDILVNALVGGAVGGGLPLGLWLLIGGWGPPCLIESVLGTATAAVTAGLALARRPV